MRWPGIKWLASSLPECIVASLILMTVFLLAMDVLSQLNRTEGDRKEMLTVEAALRQGYREWADNWHEDGQYEQEWGGIKVEAVLTFYCSGVRKLSLVARPGEGHSCVKRNFLIRDRYEE